MHLLLITLNAIKCNALTIIDTKTLDLHGNVSRKPDFNT